MSSRILHRKVMRSLHRSVSSFLHGIVFLFRPGAKQGPLLIKLRKNICCELRHNNTPPQNKIDPITLYLFYCFITVIFSMPPPVFQHNTEIQEHCCSSKCHHERKLVQVHKYGGRLHQYIIPVRKLVNSVCSTIK